MRTQLKHYYIKRLRPSAQIILHINNNHSKNHYGKSEGFGTSGGPVIGPLLGCKTFVFCALAFPDVTSANSLRWPSSNSDVRLWVIDDAEVIVS
jgi:hypothetical protein